LALKIESLTNSTFFKNLGKTYNFNIIGRNKTIVVYVIFLGCREIAQRAGKILPKV